MDKIAAGLIPAPNKVWLAITNHCNLRCAHCLPESRDRMPCELDEAEWLALIDACAAIGVRRLAFTGGEPTLRKELPDLVQRAFEHGMRVYVETHGGLINEARLKVFQDAGLGVLNLSIDGASAAVHDSFRGRLGSWKRVVSAARLAVARGIDTRIYCTVTRHNLHEALELPALLSTLPAPLGVLTYAYFVPVGRGAANASLTVPPAEWRAFCKTVDDLRASYEPRVGPIRWEPTFVSPTELATMDHELGYDVTCIARGRDYVYINPEGDVYGCVLLAGTRRVLGNVRETPLSDIWKRSSEWRFFGSRSEGCNTCPALTYHAEQGGINPLMTDLSDVDGGLVPICPLTQYPKIEPWTYDSHRRAASGSG